MLVLRPETVSFGGSAWSGVDAVTIERSAARTVDEFGDLGRFMAYADVPEQRVTVQVMGVADRGWSQPVSPGDAGDLVFESSRGRTDGGRSRVTVSCVVVRVKEDWRVGGASRTVTLVGVSADGGASDPVTVEEV
ncbi:MAG: hypothetical protein ACTS22_09940 [Phycisphaerales bacterium]